MKGVLAIGFWVLAFGTLVGCGDVAGTRSDSITLTLSGTRHAVSVQATADPELAAPDFALLALGGGMVRLGEQRGRWVLLNFWATWCEPCKAEMSLLQELADQYEEQLVVLGINQRESADEVRAFATDYGVRFPLLLDPDDALLMNYGVMGLPLTFVINPAGEIVARQFGAIDAVFVAQLAAWLAN